MKMPVAALLLWTASSLLAQAPPPATATQPIQVANLKADPIDVPNELLFKPPQHMQNPKCYFVGVNDSGVAVGSVVSNVITDDANNIPISRLVEWHAFVWKAGKITLLDGPLPVHDATYAVSINNRGQILVYQAAADGPHYFLYEPDLAHFRAVGTMGKVPANPQPFRLSKITGINDKGEIAGYVENVAGVRGVPTMGAPGDVTAPAAPAMYTALSCPGKPFYLTGAINSRGDVAGACDNGKTVFIAKEGGAVATFASPTPRLALMNGLGIDDADDLVAFDEMNSNVTGFLYRNGQYTSFPGLGVRSINNRSQIAGTLPMGRGHSSAFLTKLQP